MATNVLPSINSSLLFIQLRNEIEDTFTDLHQMLNIRRHHLLDKLTELEEVYNNNVKNAKAVSKLKSAIANMEEGFNNLNILEDTQHLALSIFQQKLENLEKVTVKSVNIDKLKLICDKTKFQNCVNSICVSSSKLELEYRDRTVPILSRVNRGTNKGEIYNPTGICIDSDLNEVYICDYNPVHGSRIHVFSLDGVFIREFGKGNLKYPDSIALSDSDVFVTNSIENHCLIKFNKDGTFVKKFGSQGIGNGMFNLPLGLCIVYPLLYMCDSRNNRIQVFDLDLSFLFKFTPEGISNPQGIKHYSNQLFISKQTGSTIFVYTLEGTPINVILLSGKGSHFNKGCHFSIDLAGNFLISDYESSCIKIFSLSGECIASLGKQHLKAPSGIDITKQGLIVCVCSKDNAVFQTY